MKARSCRLQVEALEDRCVPSTVAYGDFNNDGLMDIAAIAAPTTIIVRLANPNGSDTVSATLLAPKSMPMLSVTVGDFDADGDLDIHASGSRDGSWYQHTWLGDGDGTFGSRHTEQWKFPKWWI